MTQRFTWSALPSRVVFAPGALQVARDEVARLERHRVLLVGGGTATRVPFTRLRDALGDLVVGEVGGSEQHVPAGVAAAATDTARASGADVVVTIGGGSTTGLGKVIAVTCDLPLLAVPTTYSGSEMTAIWGRTTDGRKHTAFDIRVLPRTVIYDPDLCMGMPTRLAAASGMNALAHCLEALWSAGANPITAALAIEAGRRLVHGLPRVVADAYDADGHAGNLIGACLAGVVLAQAGIAVHHRTCHVLGGGWRLPHAETHAAVLPHSTALVAPHAPDAMLAAARILDDADPPGALFALLHRLHLPVALSALGMPEDGLDEAARRIVEASRDDPLVSDRAVVRQMLDDAFFGRTPSHHGGAGDEAALLQMTMLADVGG
ncbi:MAG: maleylacetate reductase [Chloroflexota bacterium]|nr:maleylacetate reductase [Chloroflexota bacterium]